MLNNMGKNLKLNGTTNHIIYNPCTYSNINKPNPGLILSLNQIKTGQ